MAITIATTPWAATNQNPAYHGTFIPEIWSGKLIEKFYARPSWPRSRTPTTKARSRTRATRSYPHQADDHYPGLSGRRSLGSSVRPLRTSSNSLIDQAKYFNLMLDDVMEVQADVNMMNMWSDDAAQQFKIVIDGGCCWP